MHARKSNLSIFHIRIAASKSKSPATADIMIAARIAFGVYLKRGVMNSKVKNTTQDITIFETAVSHPAMKLTADRENEPARTITSVILYMPILLCDYMCPISPVAI